MKNIYWVFYAWVRVKVFQDIDFTYYVASNWVSVGLRTEWLRLKWIYEDNKKESFMYLDFFSVCQFWIQNVFNIHCQ